MIHALPPFLYQKLVQARPQVLKRFTVDVQERVVCPFTLEVQDQWICTIQLHDMSTPTLIVEDFRWTGRDWDTDRPPIALASIYPLELGANETLESAWARSLEAAQGRPDLALAALAYEAARSSDDDFVTLADYWRK